jgi:hypothetical protein
MGVDLLVNQPLLARMFKTKVARLGPCRQVKDHIIRSCKGTQRVLYSEVTIPGRWGIHLISPLLKKGDKGSP